MQEPNNDNDPGAISLVALGFALAGGILLATGQDWPWWGGCFALAVIVWGQRK